VTIDRYLNRRPTREPILIALYSTQSKRGNLRGYCWRFYNANESARKRQWLR
jgi:hypothetical protein